MHVDGFQLTNKTYQSSPDRQIHATCRVRNRGRASNNDYLAGLDHWVNSTRVQCNIYSYMDIWPVADTFIPSLDVEV